MSRQALIAKVHLGAKQLGLDDDLRRDLMEQATGKRSAADCTDAQLVEVLDAFKARGWKPQVHVSRGHSADRKPGARPADHPAAKKARALWISLGQLGVVRNTSEQALEAFAKRQLKVERLQWADQSQCFRLIEALKKMAEREGWSQDVGGIAPAEQVSELKRRLLRQMHHRLGTPAPAGVVDHMLDTAIAVAAAQLRERGG